MDKVDVSLIHLFLVSELKKKLGLNLFAVISDGSVAFNDFKNHWSDVDIVLVVEKFSIDIKQDISRIKEKVEKKYNRHFGINTILKSEFERPIKPTISLDGKTLQALVELDRFPKRLLYCSGGKVDSYIPNREDIKEYSLSNITMFLLRSRRDLTTKKLRLVDDYKLQAEREIRAAFIITKLAVQYVSAYIPANKLELIKEAKTMFSDFNFAILEENVVSIADWKCIKTKHQLIDVLSKNDDFIECFCNYILKNSKA